MYKFSNITPALSLSLQGQTIPTQFWGVFSSMMKFILITVSALLQLGHSFEFCSFLDETFRYKNVKTVFVTSCSTKNNQLTFSWRKSSLEPISVHFIKKASRFLPQSSHDHGETIGILMDPACDVSQKISWLQDAGALENKFIVVTWSNDGSRLDENLMSIELRNAIDFFHVVTNGSEVLVFNRQLNLVMTWDANSGLQDLSYSERLSLSGKTVTGMVSLIDGQPSSNALRQALEEKSSITHTDNLMKFSFVIHKFLEEMYNFRWDLYLSGPQAADEVYAIVNGSLNYNIVQGGQFEALKTGSVDVGLFPAEQLPAGLDFMEFLHPITTFRQFFVFSSPVSYLEPHIVYSRFSGPVWGISVVLSLLIAVVSSVSARAIIINEQDSKELTFATNVLNVVGAMAQQGLERTSSKLSVRIAHFFLLFLTLMLFMFYNTGLLMYTLNPSQKEIRSFAELLRRGYIIAAENTPYNKFQLQGNYSHPDEWFYQNCQTGWGTCRTEVEFYNLSVGANKIQNERTALFGYGPNIYGALEDIMTDRELTDVKQVAVHKPFLISTFVRKHFPYKELFSRGLLLLKEAGITYHEDHTWNTKKPDPLIDSYFVIASLYSTSVAFFLLFAGILASLVLFVLEMVSWRESLAVRLEKATLKHLANRQLVSHA